MPGQPPQVFKAVALYPSRNVLDANRLEQPAKDSDSEDRSPIAVEHSAADHLHHGRGINRGCLGEHFNVLIVPP